MFTGLESPTHLLLILLVVLLLFGAKRLPELGRNLGQAMREFKGGINAKDEPEEKVLEDVEGEQTSTRPARLTGHNTPDPHRPPK